MNPAKLIVIITFDATEFHSLIQDPPSGQYCPLKVYETIQGINVVVIMKVLLVKVAK